MTTRNGSWKANEARNTNTANNDLGIGTPYTDYLDAKENREREAAIRRADEEMRRQDRIQWESVAVAVIVGAAWLALVMAIL